MDWFSLGRDNGGPALYGDFLHIPNYFDFKTILIIAVFVVPLVVFLIVSPSIRAHKWPSAVIFLMCCFSGYVLTLSLYMSSWMYGETEIDTIIGPHYPKISAEIGFWAGLEHVNLTFESEDLHLNERLYITSHAEIHQHHKNSLKNGWVWTLVTITEYLCGGASIQGTNLGICLMNAGKYTQVLILSALYTWFIASISFAYFPSFAYKPLMATALLSEASTIIYAISVYSQCPLSIIIEGTELEFHLGTPWYLVSSLGVFLSMCSMALYIHNQKRRDYMKNLHGIHQFDEDEMPEVEDYYGSFYGHYPNKNEKIQRKSPIISNDNKTITYKTIVLNDTTTFSNSKSLTDGDVSKFELRLRTPPQKDNDGDRRISGSTFTTFSPQTSSSDPSITKDENSNDITENLNDFGMTMSSSAEIQDLV